MIQTFLSTIMQTKTGASITSGSFFTGLLLRFSPEILHTVNDILQMIAFIITICVGLLTLGGIYKKRKNNPPE